MKPYNAEFEARMKVHQGLRRLVNSGVRISKIAEKSGLSHNTVANQLYQKTTMPRAHTLFALLEQVGITVTFSEAITNIVSIQVQRSRPGSKFREGRID